MVEFADAMDDHRAAWTQAQAGNFAATDKVLRAMDTRMRL